MEQLEFVERNGFRQDDRWEILAQRVPVMSGMPWGHCPERLFDAAADPEGRGPIIAGYLIVRARSRMAAIIGALIWTSANSFASIAANSGLLMT